MVTLATSQSARSKRTSRYRVNGFPGENELKDLRFKLAHNLQSTLDLQTAVELFFENIQSLVPVSGLHYGYAEEGIDIVLGSLEKHSACYSIASTDTHLGKVTFRRDKCFVEAELAILEMLIGVLFFPLRNALLYREALESSMRDALTGIGNRASMELSFSREIKLSLRHEHPLSLLLIDVDHFKKINDTIGHRNGDRTLQQIVKSVQKTLRETDQIFRYGGEEFVALLHNTEAEDAKLIAERIRLNVAMSPLTLEKQDILSTVSIGVSRLESCDTTETLFEKADVALYQAKEQGRNKVVVAEDTKKDNQRAG